MRRHASWLVAGLLLAGMSFAALAQETSKIYHVGILGGGAALSVNDERRIGLINGLADRGFIEGRNLAFESRWAEGHLERLPALAAELIKARVNAIVTFGYPTAVAAKQATTTVPLVVTGSGDPVATGLVEGLARPGGNMTGLTELSTELSAKRLQLLQEAVPGLKRVAMIWNAADLGMTLRTRAAETAAKTLGIDVQTLGVREPEDFDEAFAAMIRDRPDAIMMVSDALTILNRKRIVEFASANRLPTIYELAGLARDGGLMSYGANQASLGDRAADFVARILKGARPAELPLEQPTKFEFVVNLKTAKILGLVIPQSVLIRADEVIE
ncbi:MAG: ABC transporter substrate-binding protein [Proteobacteria bacterium]|nr:ABC transporter substrate-binding protein [Pseudomonadota bacterium]